MVTQKYVLLLIYENSAKHTIVYDNNEIYLSQPLRCLSHS